VHYNIYKYQCTDCGRLMKSKSGYVEHVKNVHSKNPDLYKCTECDKAFKQRGNLKSHMLSHSLEKKYSCKICLQSFKYPDQLSKHKNQQHVHNHVFACLHCDKKFVRMYELKRHMQVYHSGLVYVCDICKSRCAHRHTLIRHFRRKHKEHIDLLRSKDYVDKMLHYNDVARKKMETDVEKTNVIVPQDGLIIPMDTEQEMTEVQSEEGTMNIPLEAVDGLLKSTDGTFAISGIPQTVEGPEGQIVILHIVDTGSENGAQGSESNQQLVGEIMEYQTLAEAQGTGNLPLIGLVSDDNQVNVQNVDNENQQILVVSETGEIIQTHEISQADYSAMPVEHSSAKAHSLLENSKLLQTLATSGQSISLIHQGQMIQAMLDNFSAKGGNSAETYIHTQDVTNAGPEDEPEILVVSQTGEIISNNELNGMEGELIHAENMDSGELIHTTESGEMIHAADMDSGEVIQSETMESQDYTATVYTGEVENVYIGKRSVVAMETSDDN